jgi:hypothetical protein
LKPLSIYGAFSTLIPCLLVLSLVKKFDSTTLEFGPKKMSSQKIKLEDQIEIKIIEQYIHTEM